MAYGRPVVATSVGGLVDAIEDGVTGLLVEAAGLRRELEQLLDDSERRARLGGAARERVKDGFVPGATAHALRQAYEAALGAG